MSPVPFLDLKAQLSTIQDELERAVLSVIRDQRFILGPEVEGLEAEIATYVGTRHAVGLSSGSDALLVSLQALGAGPGDEVVTCAFSFFASAGSIARTGARPVLVDIDPETFNIDPAKVSDRVGPRTKAVLPVHLFGRCAAVEQLEQAAPGIPVIEDAAQAIGAIRRGAMAGTLGSVGCLSFFPSKNLGGLGDGGMATTDDEDLAREIRALRAHGQRGKVRYQHDIVGGNFRLDALQAAALRVKLKFLERWTEGRRLNAERYRQLFGQSGAPIILPPMDDEGCRDVYNQFVIRVDPSARDDLLGHLRRNEIGCAVYYPRGLHMQPCFADLGHREGDFPHCEAATRQSLALPIYPELEEAQLAEVVDRITESFT